MISRRDMLKTSGAALAGLAAIGGPWTRPTLSRDDDDLTRYVDPFIGTGAHGHTYPGANLPFGMVQVGPDNGVNGWDWSSGYHWSSDRIAGFSHTHLSGTGIGDMYDILVMPTFTGEPPLGDIGSRFSHERESAEPGYYSVDLLDTGITAALTATERVGLHRYGFPSPPRGLRASVIVDLGHSLNWDRPTDTMVIVESPTLISGYRMSSGWAPNQQVYFALSFSRPFRSHWLESEWAGAASRPELQGTHVKGCFQFMGATDQRIVVKVAISPVSIEAAKQNLRREAPGWNFDDVQRDAREAWNRTLRCVRVTTSSDEQKTLLYTALYHSLLAPQLFCDVDGTYRGPDGQVHEARGFRNHTVYSLWDTFRAEHPLLTLIQPERVDDLVQSMMAFYRENGLLPVWSLAGNETNTMIGYHSVPVILDAWSKGLTSLEPREALSAMIESATQDAGGLRFYKWPAPTSVEEAVERETRSSLRRVANIESRHVRPMGTIVSGYELTLGGNKIIYHSPVPAARFALIARTEDEPLPIEWETGAVPEFTQSKVSFLWLAGIHASEQGRRFQLAVNGERWFRFDTPNAEDRSFSARGPRGATLTFRATHIDQYDDLFGFMYLTLPASAVESGQRLRLRLTGDSEGTRDWLMTFEYPLVSRLSAENVYGFVEEGGEVRQLVRLDIEHYAAPTEALVYVRRGRPVETRLAFGNNRLLLPVIPADRDIHTAVNVQRVAEPALETELQLRPVRPYNYIPADWENESVSKTLEYAFDDWCIARLAEALGENYDAELFYQRAAFYRNLFDRSSGFMRGRLADGNWTEPFSPTAASHRQDEYTEGNAWQYSWFVPHDVRGLIELMGGRQAFIAKLDELFERSSELEGTAPPDISGMIGQYAHGNEPSHHIAYLYAYAGAPWKTQERVRQITETLYGTTPDGLPGNEDCGQMSAWYILSAIGLYPVNPADATYVIGSPHYERVTLKPEGGEEFTVEASGVSSANKYIQSATLNGQPLERCYITHDEIAAGGTLVLTMGDRPNTNWAVGESDVPPSMTPA
ncbi:MAG: GH92 family glycosyl hydrolase [Gemmatimonadota bacterium]|nr:MAG: GH92 family glycosyl hydrolase [Gemmatimonadota bacterium]